MSTISSQITAIKNETTLVQSQQARTTGLQNNSNMFLTLMLKQLECQDPTEPTDNTQWLSQLAQYSSLEQMTQMNSGLENCAKYINAMYDDMMINSEISQTLSMIGKDVTIQIPNAEDPKNPTIVTGNVTEASFESGSGQIKVNGNYYSIENVISIREK
jgi:flagellar basal-body rod modification protein FlgD